MKARVALASAGIFFTTACFGANLEYMGKSFPEGAGPATARAPYADWQSVALDGLPDKVIRAALTWPLVDQGALTTRGPKDIGIYRAAAPAVVLIVTRDDKLGSGSYLGDGLILTNWHVVTPSKTVGVLFKPEHEGAPLDFHGIVRADVLRTDPVRDLALIKLAVAPTRIKPLELGSPSEIQVGADVHAIGHPIGQAWTYTKGLVSQVRDDYVWKNRGEKIEHRAEVIQTQTPISPGNSGGPLLGDSGKILGVNSFGSTEGENLNYAIAVPDIARFVHAVKGSVPAQVKGGAPAQPAALPAAPAKCEPVLMFDGRNRSNDGRLVQVDTNCDGVADFMILTPDDKTKPIQALIDSNDDGKIDIIVEDTDRDGRWDISYHDVDFDGVIDLVGYHPDGKLKPSRYEKYASN